MKQPERPAGQSAVVPRSPGSRYGWFVGVLVVLIAAYIIANTFRTTPNGAAGVGVGAPLPPFAVPLAAGRLNGDANVATAQTVGPKAGRRPACSVRGPQIVNVCALYAGAPLVLALFVPHGSCVRIVDELQALAPSFPGVRFAAVALRGDRGALRTLVRRHGWTLPVGYDRDGILANLYKDASCPQVSFARAGGRVAAPALLHDPGLAGVRARVAALAADVAPPVGVTG